MANNAEARTTALLFSFSALLLLLLARAVLLQPPTAQTTRRRGADLVLAALERVVDGRAILRLVTRTNMVLLCHAILLLILRDAGVLGAPARRRRGASPPGNTIVAPADSDAAIDAFTVAPSAKSVVVWRRDGAGNADAGESGRRRIDRQPRRSPRTAATAAAIPAAAPALTDEPEQLDRHTQVSSREIVIVNKAPTTNHLPGDKDRAAAAANARRSRSDLERRVVVTGHRRKASVAAEVETAAGVELADDRRIEEFIANQWSMMRQESLQLVRTGSQQAITTC